MRVYLFNARYLLACIIAILSMTVVVAPAASAQDPPSDGCDSSFLTIPAWYNGLTVVDGENCEIRSPNDVGGVASFIWRVGLNIVEMLLRVVGYVAVGYIIYGGYQYMISAGSPDGMTSARKTIVNAAIGLVISVAAAGIVNVVADGMKMGGDSNESSLPHDASVNGGIS